MKYNTSSKTPSTTRYEVMEKVDFSITKKTDRDFEGIEFKQCIFSTLAGFSFTDCVFTSCNLGNVSVANTKMQDVNFKDCKLIGINFYEIKDFGFAIQFEGCILDYASFDKKKMAKTTFTNCKMHGVNFTGTDLSKSILDNCDLVDAVFSETNLSGADFTSSHGFHINPTLNTMKKAKFSPENIRGLLTAFDIIIQ